MSAGPDLVTGGDSGADGATVSLPVRVAVVGLGWAGRSIWLPRLREHPQFVVVGAVDPVADSREAFALEHPEVSVFDGVSGLDPAEVDLAVVAVPNHQHAAVAAELLTSGISVFLEKPVCLTSAESDQLAAAEQAGGAMLLAGSAARYRADVRALFDVVPALGAVRHIELAWVRARGVPDAGGWFTTRQLAGGGALVDLGWHLLDTVTPLLGVVEFDQVVGTTSDDFVNNRSWGAAWRHDGEPDELPGTGGDVEDTARGFLVTSGGISVSLRASWASHEALDATTITVEGSAGTAALRCTFGFSPNRQDGSTLTRTSSGQTAHMPVPDEPIGAEYRHQLDALPAMLADPTSRGRAIEEARSTINAIERFYASARRRRPLAEVASAAP